MMDKYIKKCYTLSRYLSFLEIKLSKNLLKSNENQRNQQSA
jgi:hypothetical protein